MFFERLGARHRFGEKGLVSNGADRLPMRTIGLAE
jgi:hypothetical protein